jgi:CheY-like chemotaxis protein
MLTAYRWDDVLEEAIQAGVDSFISKPVAASTVMEEFKSALQKRESGSSKRVEVADLAGKRVLLAEDVDINAEIMEMILEMREIVSERAVNGRVAVEMFESHPAGYYDAILMDIRMPEMDGLEATMTIRAMDRADAKSIPIVALTANAFDSDRTAAEKAGCCGFLSKPVNRDECMTLLKKLLGE